MTLTQYITASVLIELSGLMIAAGLAAAVLLGFWFVQSVASRIKQIMDAEAARLGLDDEAEAYGDVPHTGGK